MVVGDDASTIEKVPYSVGCKKTRKGVELWERDGYGTFCMGYQGVAN